MASLQNESRIILALEALKKDKSLCVRSAAKIYNVSHTTLYQRRAGRSPRCAIVPISQKLTESEEHMLVRYILDLDSCAFPPRPSGVQDMANRLLAARDAQPVGKNWVSNFVKRRQELRTCWIRKYDHQRSKCEDPKVIGDWFRLLRNTIAKYGMVDDDIYNFDKTGFLISMITSCMALGISVVRPSI